MKIAADVKWLKAENIPFISVYTLDSMLKMGLEVMPDAIFIVDQESPRLCRNRDDLNAVLEKEFAIRKLEDLSSSKVAQPGVCYISRLETINKEDFDHVIEIAEEDFDMVKYYRTSHEVAKIRTAKVLIWIH